jgi:hypothetical protein
VPPDGMDPLTFQGSLLFEGDICMSSGQADLGLCLYEQAYEWGRNHNCPGASLVALSRLTELAFVELAYKRKRCSNT